MSISLSSDQLARFVADLLAHREKFTLNDTEYADQILKISLNTYKKCTRLPDGAVLTFKRHTFVSIFSNTGLKPQDYGLKISVPSQASPFGGYQKSDFLFLCGRYFLYRRTFLTARHITRSILEISPSTSQECLSFDEFHSYMAEVGTREQLRYRGDVYMNKERNILSLPSFDNGRVRLTLLQPERLGSDRIKMRGAVLTYGNPKGYWQPTVSSVFVDGPVRDTRAATKELRTIMQADTSDYASPSAELARVEEHATIMTPLMWARSAYSDFPGPEGETQ